MTKGASFMFLVLLLVLLSACTAPKPVAMEQKPIVMEQPLFKVAESLEWAKGPASLPPGAEVIVLEGNFSNKEPFTFRLKLPDGYMIKPHTHPASEHVTVLSGSFHFGAGEEYDEAKATNYSAGSFIAMPSGHAMFAWAEGETVIQVHGVGPWGITYVNPADDPRKK